MTFLRLNNTVIPTKDFIEHLQKRARCKRHYRRGAPGRTFVALDESIVLRELKNMLPWEEVCAFMKTHKCTDNIFCVSAQWLHANSAHSQKCHQDHAHGYGLYFTVVFTIDGSKVDTMIENEGMYEPAACNILVYDTFHPHFGQAGENNSKVFVGFSDPGFEKYNRIAKEHLHARKKFYSRI